MKLPRIDVKELRRRPVTCGVAVWAVALMLFAYGIGIATGWSWNRPPVLPAPTPLAYPDLRKCDRYVSDAQAFNDDLALLVRYQVPLENPGAMSTWLEDASVLMGWAQVCFHANIEELYEATGGSLAPTGRGMP